MGTFIIPVCLLKRPHIRAGYQKHLLMSVIQNQNAKRWLIFSLVNMTSAFLSFQKYQSREKLNYR